MARNDHQLSLRLPNTLLAMLRASAGEHGRTTAAEMRLAAEWYALAMTLDALQRPEVRDGLGTDWDAIRASVVEDLAEVTERATQRTSVVEATRERLARARDARHN